MVFKLNKEDQDKIISWYAGNIRKFGENIKALQWKTKKSQQLRFQVLTEIADLSNKTILDAGCGFGDLFGFIKEKGIKFKYCGCDITPPMIEIAKKLHSNLEYAAIDFLELPCKRKVDYVIASGLFGIKISESDFFLKSAVRKMFNFCTKGVAFNCLGNYVDYKEDHLYYAKQEETFAFCRSLTSKVVLRNDYLPWEFTIYLYK